jgi:CheY-like chemotaxis protein/DNA-directed RNA polymerase specialized sigma24 family protein
MSVMPSYPTTDAIDHALPYLRRYARALTGNQNTGDRLAMDALQMLVEKPANLTAQETPKADLFHAFHLIWKAAGYTVSAAETALERQAHKHLSLLEKGSREALLLSSVEKFSREDVARIMELDADAIDDLLDKAHADVAESVRGSVLVIEDEAVTAMEIENVVLSMGHNLIGTARTHSDAVTLAKEKSPDLILSDIQLADGSSGDEAVTEILTSGDAIIPVIFITAFPERFLTGIRPEPAFLITKPYSEDQVRSAVSQAMFFASVETLS